MMKVNTAGTDETLFRLVPVPRHGARVLPLEQVPVPGHRAQICARAPTKGYVQTGLRARALTLNGPGLVSSSVLWLLKQAVFQQITWQGNQTASFDKYLFGGR